MDAFAKKKSLFSAIAFLALSFALTLPSALLAQYERYSGYESFDPETRIGLFYVAGTGVYIQGTGFRDIQLSDHERTPMDASDTQRMDVALGESNYNDFRGGISFGFNTMKLHGWGGGVEFDYIGFENPIIIQYAAFLNYGAWSRGSILLGPYAKVGRTSVEVELAKARGETPVRLSEIERLQGRDPVDVYDGNKFTTEFEAVYVQFGLQLVYRPQDNVALYFQLGYQNEIDVTQESRLKIDGRRTNSITGHDETGSFTVDFDDRTLVEPNTDDPARLNPVLSTGPWYFSIGVGYPFNFE